MKIFLNASAGHMKPAGLQLDHIEILDGLHMKEIYKSFIHVNVYARAKFQWKIAWTLWNITS